MFVVFGIPPSVPSQTPATEMGQSTSKWSLAPMDDVVESRCTSLTVGIQKGGWQNFRILPDTAAVASSIDHTSLLTTAPVLGQPQSWIFNSFGACVQFDFSMWQELLRVNVLTGC